MRAGRKSWGEEMCFVGAENLAETLKALRRMVGFQWSTTLLAKTHIIWGWRFGALGTFASFGNASGAIEAVSPQDLAANGSLNFTRPTLATYMGIPGWMQQSSAKVLKLVEDGVLSVEINQRYGLEEVNACMRIWKHVQPRMFLSSRLELACYPLVRYSLKSGFLVPCETVRR